MKQNAQERQQPQLQTGTTIIRLCLKPHLYETSHHTQSPRNSKRTKHTHAARRCPDETSRPSTQRAARPERLAGLEGSRPFSSRVTPHRPADDRHHQPQNRPSLFAHVASDSGHDHAMQTVIGGILPIDAGRSRVLGEARPRTAVLLRISLDQAHPSPPLPPSAEGTQRLE
jgi:hypothetical protein